jgi:hypothetical protein
MNNSTPAAVMQRRDLHRTDAEGGKMRDCVVGTQAHLQFGKYARQIPFFLTVPSGNLTEETGQQTLTFLLEFMAGAGRSQVFAAAKPPLADSTYQIHEGKLMVTAQFMRSVKEII